MNVLYTLDILGTFAFAISGALVASKKRFDLFGIVIIAFVTAVGGGILRDVMINYYPINWIGDLNYIWTILLAVLFTFLFKSKIEPLRKTMFLFDTTGIAVFTLLGTEKCLNYGLHPFVAIIMGVVSAVMGGVIRDVLTQKTPLIFKKEIYALACFIGAFVFLGLKSLNIPLNLQYVFTIVTVMSIRLIAVKYQLELPKIENDLFGKLKK
jgi:uncharacterized membrane protein YeiH